MYSIGIINYINSIPLYYGLESSWNIVKDTPRGLAKRFKRGELDVSFIPSVNYVLNKDIYVRVKGVSISSFGAVESVFLIKKRGKQIIDTVMECNESITSNFIAQIILENKYGIRPRMVMKQECLRPDARIVIGDTALKNPICADNEEILDLGAQWYQLTNLPLVYAVCVTRNTDCVRNISMILKQTVQQNLSCLDTILIQYGATEHINYLRKINYGWSMSHDKSMSLLETLCKQDTTICAAK